MESVIETFRPVRGYEGLYEVSNCGAVRSLNYQGKKRIKYLRNMKNLDGYEAIRLYRDGKVKKFSVHRLVYETFVGEIPEGYEIDHINTVRDDNRLVNLRVVTSKENSNNPITRERHLEAIRQCSQDPQWRKNQREKNQRLAKDQKWLEANREAHRKACNKPILQLNKSTSEVIRRWECARDVERELGINNANISECCNNKRNSAGGFKWRYA